MATSTNWKGPIRKVDFSPEGRRSSQQYSCGRYRWLISKDGGVPEVVVQAPGEDGIVLPDLGIGRYVATAEVDSGFATADFTAGAGWSVNRDSRLGIPGRESLDLLPRSFERVEFVVIPDRNCRTDEFTSTYWSIQCTVNGKSYYEVLFLGAGANAGLASIQIRDSSSDESPYLEGSWALARTGDFSESNLVAFTGQAAVGRKRRYVTTINANNGEPTDQQEDDKYVQWDASFRLRASYSDERSWTDTSTYTRVLRECRFNEDGTLFDGLQLEQSLSPSGSSSNSTRIENSGACPTASEVDSVNSLTLQSSTIYQCILNERKIGSDCSLLN